MDNCSTDTHISLESEPRNLWIWRCNYATRSV